MSIAGLFGSSDNYNVNIPYSGQQITDAYGNVQNAESNEGTLANALVAQSQGAGPNPALNQLNQTTQTNNANAAGLAASSRGLNPALAARMASQTAANANQTAAGQAATLSAQQQLGAEGQLTNLYGNMANQGLTQQQVGNNANLGAEGINAGAASQNTATSGQIIGGLTSGGGAAAAAFLARGGRVPGVPLVKGDSTKNDVVSAELSPEEIVIPESHAHDRKKAISFVNALMDREEGKKSKDKLDIEDISSDGAKVNAAKGFSAILSAHHDLKKRMDAMEKRSA